MSNGGTESRRRPIGPPTLSQRTFHEIGDLLGRANRLLAPQTSANGMVFWPDEDQQHWPANMREARSLREQALRLAQTDMSRRIPWAQSALQYVRYDPQAMNALDRSDNRAVTLGWQDEQSHRIQRNETLTQIADRHGLTVNYLLQLNPTIQNPNRIYAGQTINVNPIRTYLNDSAFRDPQTLNRTLVHDAFWHCGVQRLSSDWRNFKAAGHYFREADAHLRDLSQGLLSVPEAHLSLRQMQENWSEFNRQRDRTRALQRPVMNFYQDWIRSTTRDTALELGVAHLGNRRTPTVLDRRQPSNLGLLDPALRQRISAAGAHAGGLSVAPAYSSQLDLLRRRLAAFDTRHTTFPARGARVGGESAAPVYSSQLEHLRARLAAFDTRLSGPGLPR